MCNIDIINRLSFLIVSCFSFFIFVFTLCMKSKNSLINILGSVFFIPFILSASSFVLSQNTVSYILLSLSDPCLLIALLTILLIKPKDKQSNFVITLLFACPILIITTILYSKEFADFLSGCMSISTVNIPLFIISIVLIIILLVKGKGNSLLLPYSILFIVSSIFFQTYGKSNSLLYLSLILKLSGYTILFVFFRRELSAILLNKVSEAEKKVAHINKSLELEIKKRTFEIERVNEKLVNIARTDTLSKALNKAGIIGVIDNLILSRIKEFSILMFDIDNFKYVNDTYGHIEGDKCIRKLSLITRSCIRDIDSLGRYGGDEFIVVLPSISTSQAKLIAERLREKVKEGNSCSFTISIGIATYPADGYTTKELISFADEGLYISKKKGKNAVSHKMLF